jgi:hypothetical protein
MAQDADLGQLIRLLNPYNHGMDVYTLNPTPTPGGHASGTIPQIQLEVDAKYPGDWTFKGQTQKVNKAVRILYRFPVMSGSDEEATVLYWIEDYLLIGYEGSGSG